MPRGSFRAHQAPAKVLVGLLAMNMLPTLCFHRSSEATCLLFCAIHCKTKMLSNASGEKRTSTVIGCCHVHACLRCTLDSRDRNRIGSVGYLSTARLHCMVCAGISADRIAIAIARSVTNCQRLSGCALLQNFVVGTVMPGFAAPGVLVWFRANWVLAALCPVYELLRTH